MFPSNRTLNATHFISRGNFPNQSGPDQVVQWLGEPAATSKVPRSNHMDGKLSFLGPHQWLSGSALKGECDGSCRVQSSVALDDLVVRSFPWHFLKLRNTGKDPLERPPRKASHL